MSWSDARRFQWVCPLLQATPEGLRCSVAAVDVRPFWGRYFLRVGIAFLVLYTAAAVTATVALRMVGYRLSPIALLWPPHWREFGSAQEQLYALRARESFEARRFADGILSLEMVCRINPENHEARLALARLRNTRGQYAGADEAFARVISHSPDLRLPVAREWLGVLLARGEFTGAARIAARMVAEDHGQEAPWLHGLFYSTRVSRDPEPLEIALRQEKQLPPWCARLIRLELGLLKRDAGAKLELSEVRPNAASPFLPYYQVRRLIFDQRPRDALALIEAYRGSLSPDDAYFLRLDAFAALGWNSMAGHELNAGLEAGMNPGRAARFLAFLVRNPDRKRFDALNRVLDGCLASASPENALQIISSAILAASRCGAPTEKLEANLRHRLGGEPHALMVAARAMREPLNRPVLHNSLPAALLPSDVLYAVLDAAGQK